MRRREFVALIAGAGVAHSLPARAQQRMARVGILVIGAAVPARDLVISAELARLGYVEGRNVAYEIRAADGDLSRLPALARELVATKPDVLIGASAATAQVLVAATEVIPIVLTVTIDPIATGLSDSMSRPSRNVTGFTSSTPTLAAKRLELLRELVPGLSRVAHLDVPAGTLYGIFERYVTTAAASLGITVFSVPITTVASVADAFNVIDREKAQAVMVGVTPTTTRLTGHIIDECLLRDLPTIHPWSFAVHAGALMSYGPASLENHAGAAKYVDRILKGARIRDLPFEEPTEFKLAINLRTAQAMKLKIPPTLLARADEVIE
jgi:putative ABC transport system substrate-binding protein